MHIFLFHRDLRLIDNTTLIEQIKANDSVIPVFIFPPEQIDPKKNDYFSNNSVQFMIESLHELSDDIKKNNGKIYFFKGDILKVLKAINKTKLIKSIGFNIDYTPYARQRDEMVRSWCNKNDIICYEKEDYVLYDIIGCQTKKINGDPYQVFTPFKNNCINNLTVRTINKFQNFKFEKNKELKLIKYYIIEKKINNFYENNENINVHGGRSNGLEILSNISNFKDYEKGRDFLTYKTTFLSGYNHYSCISIREVYHKIISKLGKTSSLINELIWRDFYVNITWWFPHVLDGQIKGENKSFKLKYDNIKWSYNKKMFDNWCNGETGFPIVDAGMRQMNVTGFMFNRCRMITVVYLTKDLHIDWKWGEKYFATKLLDYSAMQNSGGHQWCSSSGCDASPYFRIFNPWTQTEKFDKKLEYIRTWIPELDLVPDKDILYWYKPEIHQKWLKEGIKYFSPIVDHDVERLKTLEIYKTGLNN